MQPASARNLISYLVKGGFRYGWSCAKNCVRILIGRKPYFDFEDLFFRQYCSQLARFGEIRLIRCLVDEGEGPGTQALMLICAINLARLTGLIYVHTPFFEILHADRPMPEWVDAWEKQFNLGLGEAKVTEYAYDIFDVGYNIHDAYAEFGVDFKTGLHSSTITEIRRKYYANKQPRQNGVLTVWVQVRRGEVSQFEHTHMWTETSAIATTIARVRAILEARKVDYKIYVCSQGAPEDFAELKGCNTELVLSSDALWNMREAIEADVLVMAKSNFSYVSAVVCDGIKLYQPHYIGVPQSDWLLLRPDGEFDVVAFEQKLLQFTMPSPRMCEQSSLPSVHSSA